MVEIVFHQASFFKRIVDSLKDLVEDVTFNCDSDGMTLQAIDVSHVSLISIELPAETFSTYTCTEPLELSFNVGTLIKVLKSAGSNDLLTIKTDHQNEDIEIQINSPNDEKSTRFKLKPVDVQKEPVSIPMHQYRAKLSLGSDGLTKLVKSLSEVNDSVTVNCTDGSVSFSVSDSLVDAITTYSTGEVPGNMDEDVEVNVSESCRVSYALRYLKAISAESGLASRVTLHFSPNFPLLVEYQLNEGGFVKFYLAPKVDEDGSDEEL
ncbi:proliferating cell nuclear antigen [Histomonas meleagridis]|uniref:proliferating cell nuclear antigen n=1 Tax=Histomonas meleagridis TaxID=135588 RepID=UPI00355A43A9|nr:proliferating cell nuclear antigen [Histomonas meleagridis]KAH0801276.1 proliferating cell nuclear antigen [Histomonas meleagridis]